MSAAPIQKIRVPLGFAYGLLFLWLSRPTPALLVSGLAIAALGLALRVWASGHLNKGRELASRGPYAWTRNPLYLGSFVMGLGFTTAGGRWLLVLLFPLLFLAVYWPVMRREERELTDWLGAPYTLYRDSVSLFVPSFRRFAPVSGPGQNVRLSNFQWSQVIYNREHKAIIGFILVAAFLWVKMIWL